MENKITPEVKKSIKERLNLENLENKIVLGFVLILVIFGISYIYKTGSVGPAEREIHDSCHVKALELAKEDFKEKNPQGKERIERGAYLLEDYNKHFRDCLAEEQYQ